MSGVKKDEGKVQMELLSGHWLYGVATVLTFGAKKYSAHNWRKGLHQSRLLGAAFRHLVDYLGGEDLDPESGLSHLYHASCCLMFASELKETHPELDDRYKSPASRAGDSDEEYTRYLQDWILYYRNVQCDRPNSLMVCPSNGSFEKWERAKKDAFFVVEGIQLG